MKHLYVVDIFRGLAALSVCLFHFNGTLRQSDPFPAAVDSLLSAGHLGVACFFVISGFVIPLSMKNWDGTIQHDLAFIRRRLIRILPSYLAATGLALLLWKLSSLHPDFRGVAPSVSMSTLVTNATLTAGVFQMPWILIVAWTLAIEVQFYLVMPVLYPLFINRRPWIRAASLWCFALAPLALPQSNWLPSYAALFACGIAMYLFQAGQISGLMLTFTLIVAAMTDAVVHQPAEAAVAIGTALGLRLRVPQSSVLKWLGDISYSLYLVHVLIGGRVVNYGLRLPPFPVRNLALIVAATATSLVAAHAFFKLIDQPSIALSRGKK